MFLSEKICNKRGNISIWVVGTQLIFFAFEIYHNFENKPIAEREAAGMRARSPGQPEFCAHIFNLKLGEIEIRNKTLNLQSSDQSINPSIIQRHLQSSTIYLILF